MASVRKLNKTDPKSPWVVEYTDAFGKRRRHTPKSGLKKDADAFRKKVEQEIESGKHIPDSEKVTVPAVSEEFIRMAEQKHADGTLGKSRLTNLKMVVDRHIKPFFGKKKISDITWGDVMDFRAAMVEKGIKAITIKQYVVVLKQIEDYARKRGYTTGATVSDACKEFSGAQARKVRTFTLDEMKALLTELGTRRKQQKPRQQLMLKCAVHLAAFCGLRYGEIMGLTLDNIDMDRRILRIRHSLTAWDELKGPKTVAGRRDVPMPDHVVMLLAEWIATQYAPNDRRLLFRQYNLKQVKSDVFHNGLWKPLLHRAGLIDKPPHRRGRTTGTGRVRLMEGFKGGASDDLLHFHALRHFAASNMIENGLPVTEVAAILGHSKFDMTLQVYAHPIVGGSRRHEAMQQVARSLIAPPTLDATPQRQPAVSH